MFATEKAGDHTKTAMLSSWSQVTGLVLAIALAFSDAPVHAGPTLMGFALLDANTFAEGPTSSQFIEPNNGITPPFIDKQPV